MDTEYFLKNHEVLLKNIMKWRYNAWQEGMLATEKYKLERVFKICNNICIRNNKNWNNRIVYST